MESITSSTCFPWAAKYSAMVVAAKAARMRERGGWSDVETTTTERDSPSSPNAFFQKFAHFAAALSDESQHRQIRGCAASHHTDERALAHAAAAENAHALSATAGQHSVDRANAATERLANDRARQRQAARFREEANIPARGRDLSNRAAHPFHRSRARVDRGPREAKGACRG